MTEINRTIIPTSGREIRSLCWHNDELIDWVSGGIRYRLDGSQSDPHINWTYRFDKAVMSDDGVYAIIYEQLGTKGLVLKQGRLIREINRSFYCANVYEYPVAIFKLQDGRTVLAHCPDEYCKIEIEDIESGTRLTHRETKAMDFFHSRLQASPDCRFLLSAGWIWHPLDSILLFNIQATLNDPGLLDHEWSIDLGEGLWEIHTAAFLDNHRVVFTMERDMEDKPPEIGVFDLEENRIIYRSRLEENAGTLMPTGQYVVGFFDYPKLIEPETGKVIYRWSDLKTGSQNSSIIHHLDTIPPLALDAKNKRFAVAGTESITVIQLG